MQDSKQRVYSVRTRDYEVSLYEKLDADRGPTWTLSIWSRKTIALPAIYGEGDDVLRYETQPIPSVEDTLRTSHIRDLIPIITDAANFVEQRQREVRTGALRYLMAPEKRTRKIKRKTYGS